MTLPLFKIQLVRVNVLSTKLSNEVLLSLKSINKTLGLLLTSFKLALPN
jgi:hypothetical protein